MSASIYLFWDNSNVFISAKTVAEKMEGITVRESIRISFENLFKLALAGRSLGKAFVVGSIPPELKDVWDEIERRTGIKPELYERGKESGREQGLDQCLQVHMLRAINDNQTPQIAVLMTGDGAGYDDGVGFHADLERMSKAGWGIEVVTWGTSCRKALKLWAVSNGCFIPLEDYYKSVTFVEGIRRVVPLNLTKRPSSHPKPNPAKIAEERVIKSYQEELSKKQEEIDALKKKKTDKEIKKRKYLERMARNKH